eukprot:scaffold30431_cov31-Tisochrysis_lutea.AAC.2
MPGRAGEARNFGGTKYPPSLPRAQPCKRLLRALQPHAELSCPTAMGARETPRSAPGVPHLLRRLGRRRVPIHLEGLAMGTAPELGVPHAEVAEKCCSAYRDEEGEQRELADAYVIADDLNAEGVLETISGNTPSIVLARADFFLAGHQAKSSK